MRYYLPDIEPSWLAAPQVKIEEKLGGLPWGLPADRWPICQTCDGPMTLLAQLIHHPDRLNLGAPGRNLFVFHCANDPGMCEDWDGASGGNACLIIEPDELGSQLTQLPNGIDELTGVETRVEVYPEVRIGRWLEKDDGLDQSDYNSFLNANECSDLEDGEKVPGLTKLGSVPFWVQGPEVPEGGWTFVGQLDSKYSFFHPMPELAVASSTGRSQASCGTEDTEKYFGREWLIDGPNFGDCGIGYIFVRDLEKKPEGWFLWQCS